MIAWPDFDIIGLQLSLPDGYTCDLETLEKMIKEIDVTIVPYAFAITAKGRWSTFCEFLKGPIAASDHSLAQLWIELLTKVNDDPYIDNEQDGLYCYFCDQQWNEDHLESCVFVRAKKLVEDRK